MSTRLEKLLEMQAKSPNDTFLLYGLAMEYKKAGQTTEAIEYFDRVIGIDPGYCYAYHQKGLTYESLNALEEARKSYREGISAAQKKGDAHAAEEIAAALSMIE